MRQEKTLLLDEIKEKIEQSKAFIIAKYENITPGEAWNFRKNLSANSSELEVVKKRILIKALKECGYTYKLDELSGHIAVVFMNGDPISSTKIVFDFGNMTLKLQVLKGEIEGKSYSKDEMETLSKLPSMNDLRAQFVGLLEAPMAQTLSVMESVLSSIINLIEEKKKLKEKK